MLKKLLTYTLAVSTVMWSVGLLATPLAVGAASSGDLIKLQCATGSGVNDPCRAVYYLGADSKRYVFPNEKTYKTWYSDFSGVEVVSSTEMSSYPIGGNVTYRPGVKMVKITTDPKVYAVGANGALMWVTTGEIATALYGASWATTSVEDVSDAFFVNYTIGSNITDASQFNKQAQMDAAPTINDDKNLSSTPGDDVSTGTSLTVSLASDTPASGVVLGNTINNKFTKVNLTASADGNIVIDQLKIQRVGTGQDGAFSGIVLIDAASNLRIDDPKTLNSEHMATFNDDIVIAAGTTKSVYIAGNMGTTTTYAGEAPALALSSVTLSGSATVIGSLPITGNSQNINGTIAVGSLSVKNGGTNPDAQTQKIGTTDYVVSSVTLTANGVEDFQVNQITFDNGGSSSETDTQNLDVVVNNAVRGTLGNSNDDKATFNFNPPLMIEKGKNVDIDLRLDIADGSNRTIRFDIEDESDLRAVGQTYGAEVKVADGGAGATADATPFWLAPVTTIDVGSLRVGPATLAATNIADDEDDVVLGKFEFEAKGEAIEITRLPIAFTITTSTGNLGTDSTIDLTNVTLEDANGSVIAGPLDPTFKFYDVGGVTKTALLVATTTDTITIPAGVHVYTVRADLDSDFGANDTIVARINPGQMTAKGDTTGITVTPTPGSDQSSATMTVKSAALSLSVSPTPVAATVVAGTQNYVFANIVLGANSSGEDIRVTQVKVAVKCNTLCNPAEVSNFSIYDGATELSTTNDPDSQTATKTTDDQDATSTFTFTTSLVIPKGASKTLTIKGNISNSATNGAMTVGMPDSTSGAHVTAKGNDTNLDATVTLSIGEGQAQTFSSVGTLTITRDSSSPKDGLLPANSNGLTFAVFSATSQNEAINIEKLYLTAVAANGGGFDQIKKIYVYNEGTLLAQVSPTSSDGTDKTVLIDITNTPIVVPADSNVKLTIKVDTQGAQYTAPVSLGASGEGLWLKINAAGDVTAKGAQSGTAVSSITVTNASSTAQYLFRSVPTVATNDLLTSAKIASGSIISGTESSKALYAFSVTAGSSGDIALHRVQFLITTSTATVTALRLSDGVTNVAYQETGAFKWISYTEGTQTGTGVAPFFFVDNATAPASGAESNNVVPYTIAAGQTKTFTLIGDIACTATGGAACSGVSGSGSVNIQFLGDTVLEPTTPFGAYGKATTAVGLNSAAFVWGDYWRTSALGNSSTTASVTEQWSNGALVNLTNGGKMVSTSSAVTFSR